MLLGVQRSDQDTKASIVAPFNQIPIPKFTQGDFAGATNEQPVNPRTSTR